MSNRKQCAGVLSTVQQTNLCIGMPDIAVHTLCTLPADDPVAGSYSCFKGSSDDYNDLYAAAAKSMSAAYEDGMVGGPALAYNTRHSRKAPRAPSGDALLHAVAEQDLPLAFFSYHIVSACSLVECDVSKVGCPPLLHICSWPGRMTAVTRVHLMRMVSTCRTVILSALQNWMRHLCTKNSALMIEFDDWPTMVQDHEHPGS